jgi:hypothetical protein
MPARDGTSCLSTANAKGVGAFQHYSVGASIMASEYIEGGKKYRLAELAPIGVAIMSSLQESRKKTRLYHAGWQANASPLSPSFPYKHD